MKRYPNIEPDSDYKRRLGEAARAALLRREEQRRWREMQQEIHEEVRNVIDEHYGLDEVMRGRT